MHEHFDSYSSFLKYLVDRGHITQGSESDVESALAAFESTQVRRGVKLATTAMEKATRKLTGV